MRRVLLVAGLLAGMLLSSASAALAAPDKGLSSTNRARAESALREVQDLFAGRGVRTGRELTPALLDLAKRRDALSATDRRKANDFLARPDGEGGPDQFGDDYTVTEATPLCSTNFCVHYVTSTVDAPPLTDTTPANGVPDYVEQMLAEFEFTFTVENTNLGWAQPKSDGTKGPDTGKTDVYIMQLGDRSIFGYAATDPEDRGTRSAYGYLVMDDDYVEFGYPDPLDPLKVTAAHEYNHVLQFTYDWIQDKWMLESTATWMEEQVYPAINDYVSYLTSWSGCTEPPITQFNPPGTSCDAKVYGTAVWNHLLEAFYGDDVVRRAWELSASTTPEPDFAPDAYDEAIQEQPGGIGFSDDFGIFAATVAEWQTPGSPYPDHISYPDIERIGAPLTTSGVPRTETLDHTSFRLINVAPDSSQPAIELRADVPAGMAGALALVGRVGTNPELGAVTLAIEPIPPNGQGAVTLDDPGDFGRITAVLVNADPSQAGFTSDWLWTRDAQAFTKIQVVPPGTPRDPPPDDGGGDDGGGDDDDVIPPPPPPPPPALTSKFSLKSSQKLGTALKRGVLTNVQCNLACKVKVELRLDAKTAKKLKLKRVVGTKTVTLTNGGTKAVRVKLGKKARAKFRKRRSVKLTAVMRATTAGSAAGQRTGKVTLKR